MEQETDYESQKLKIRKHLESGKTITQLDAWKLFQCFNLRNRICELRRDDHMAIFDKSVQIGKKRFKVYSGTPFN